MSTLEYNSLQYQNATNRSFNDDFNNYLLQSLANLGQRLGVKGDSIKTSSFAFIDLFDEAKSSFYNSLTHIGVIERKYGSVMSVSIVPKSTLSVGTGKSAIEHTIYNYSNTANFNSALDITSDVDSIDSFCQNSFISNIKPNRCVLCGIGQKKNDKGEYEKREFIYEEFDRDTNNLISGLRILNPNNSSNVLLITFNRFDSELAEVEVFNISSNPDSLRSVLDKIDSLLSTLNSSGSASNESKINSMNINYWINYLRLNRYGKNYDILSDLNYPFGTEVESNILNGLSDTNKDKLSSMIKKYGEGVRDAIHFFEYDKDSKLPTLKQYYTETLYASSKNSFREQIIQAIFNAIYPLYPGNAKVFIPVDYVFNYYCNSNESWKIYGGVQDINVRFVNTSISKNNIKSYYADDQLLANISGDNQNALFNYSVQYDPENDDLIYSVNVEKKYTLPYVNSDNVWVINNQITNIPASGKDAGNPNIVIVYNFNKSDDSVINRDFKILAAADKDNVLSGIGWKKSSVRIEPIEQINLEDPSVVNKSDMYTICCRVPNLSGADNELQRTKALNILEYSLIINISSVSCFDKVTSDIRKRYGDYGVVTTLWKFDEKTVSFLPITDPNFDGSTDNVALDIINLTNLNNLVKWHIMNHEPKHPDRYTHSWLVFDNAKQETKNSINDWRTYVYPVIQNKTAEEVAIANYINDFNLAIKYNDSVSGATEQNIKGILNSGNKYITKSTINTTNNIYYYNESSNIVRNYDDYVPNQDMPSLTLSEVFTRDLNVVNRTNMISFDQNGYMFYSYIGSSFNDLDKNKVHIGGSYTNINIGSETMISNSNRNLFQRPTELHFDFENTFTNGYSYAIKDLFARQDIFTSHINWEVHKLTNIGTGVYSTSFIPTSKMMIQYTGSDQYKPWMTIVQFNNSNAVRFADDNRYEAMTIGQIRRYHNNAGNFVSYFTNEYDYKLWIPTFYYNKNSKLFKRESLFYNGEALYIPALFGKLRLSQWNSKLDYVVLKSNMDIVKYNDKPIMLLTSNKFLENMNFSKSVSSNSVTANFTLGGQEVFTGNPLEISYYEMDDKLYITINETQRKQSFSNLFKLKLEY